MSGLGQRKVFAYTGIGLSEQNHNIYSKAKS